MGAKSRDGLFKRERSPFWWHWDPITKKRESTGFRDREAARAYRAGRERLAADPAYEAAQRATLGEWVSRWLTSKAAEASPATMTVARQKLGHWVTILGESRLLITIEAVTFDQYVATRRADQVSNHTISKEVTHMIAVLKYAKRRGYYAGDVDVLRPENLHAGYVPRKRSLSRAELAALLSELEPNRAAVVAVCVALGCRISEARRLLPTDISAGHVLIRGRKTKEALRTVPILSLYRPLLDKALGYLPVDHWTNVNRDIASACARAGIPKATPNDLRRTHSTLLIEAGVDKDVVRRLLGHTTSAMVDRVYGQPSPEALATLAERHLGNAEKLLTAHSGHTVETTGEESVAPPAGVGPATNGLGSRRDTERGPAEFSWPHDKSRSAWLNSDELLRVSLGTCAPVSHSNHGADTFPARCFAGRDLGLLLVAAARVGVA